MKIEFLKRIRKAVPELTMQKNMLALPLAASFQVGSKKWEQGGLYSNSGVFEASLSDHMDGGRLDVLAYCAARTIPDEVLFAGVMQAHFGHFFCESISRLWALDVLGAKIPLVYISKKSPLFASKGTPIEFFELISLKNPIILVREPTIFEIVWNATCLFDPMVGVGLHPKLRDWLSSRLPTLQSKFGPKLYVSRSGAKPSSGRILGETFVEQGLQHAGYQIMRPEDHSLAEQIAAYRQAGHIILSESSALHLMAIFCGPNTKIALIKRRPSSPRGIASVETSFAGAKPHYISAFKAYWNNGLGLDANDAAGVAVLDFSYLWQYLADHEFIDKPKAMPHPDEAEIEKERLEIAADRDFRFDLVPGAKYGKRGSKNLA